MKEMFVVDERYSFDDERDAGDEIDVEELKTINQRVREDHLEKCSLQLACHYQSQHQRKVEWPTLQDHQGKSTNHWGPYCSAERSGLEKFISANKILHSNLHCYLQ